MKLLQPELPWLLHNAILGVCRKKQHGASVACGFPRRRSTSGTLALFKDNNIGCATTTPTRRELKHRRIPAFNSRYFEATGSHCAPVLTQEQVTRHRSAASPL